MFTFDDFFLKIVSFTFHNVFHLDIYFFKITFLIVHPSNDKDDYFLCQEKIVFLNLVQIDVFIYIWILKVS